MNRLLRRFGARSSDAALPTHVDIDPASAVPSTETGHVPAPSTRFTLESTEGAPSGHRRRVGLSGRGTDSAPLRLSDEATDRRWAAIGRGTPDLAAMDGYDRAPSPEAGR
ncbi:hypothetical protein [Nocardia xishanensis]|uniref:hypothetical protein n=1 Tax=Nocardia xishanensis TaxID=238964 RepID=UPI003439FEF5